MTLDQLIDEYKQMAAICHNFDLTDKKAVKRNNKAVSRMYEIVHKIRKEFGYNGVTEFAKLIDIKQDRVDLWASIQMLEKMTFDKGTEKKALAIIKEEAKDSLGHQYWLKIYQDKKKYDT
jgi:predicted transcriptional regulator